MIQLVNFFLGHPVYFTKPLILFYQLFREKRNLTSEPSDRQGIKIIDKINCTRPCTSEITSYVVFPDSPRFVSNCLVFLRQNMYFPFTRSIRALTVLPRGGRGALSTCTYWEVSHVGHLSIYPTPFISNP